MVFAALPRAVHERLFAAGAQYHLWGATLDGDNPDEMLTARFVCDWSITDTDIDRFLRLL